MNNNDVILGLAWYVVFVLSLSFHEAAHTFAAMKLGDKTAYYSGQVVTLRGEKLVLWLGHQMFSFELEE